MASYAHLIALLPCPHCGAFLPGPDDNLLAFQWGYCPSRQPWNELFYRPGDPLHWRLDDAGRIPPWSYFEGVLQGGNVGDPAVRDLLVRAFDLGGGDLCCGGRRGGDIALRIEGGRIVRLDRIPPGCDVALLHGDGSVEPRPEWDDHPMPSILRVRSDRLARGDGVVIPALRAP